MTGNVVQLSPLLSSIERCECGHPEGEHQHGYFNPYGRGEDICWGHVGVKACSCHQFAQARGGNTR